MTLFKGAILILESQPDGQQRKFKVLELSWANKQEDGKETQLVRLEIVE